MTPSPAGLEQGDTDGFDRNALDKGGGPIVEGKGTAVGRGQEVSVYQRLSRKNDIGKLLGNGQFLRARPSMMRLTLLDLHQESTPWLTLVSGWHNISKDFNELT